MGGTTGAPGIGTLVRDIVIFAGVLLAAWLASRALARQARGAAGATRGFTLLGALALGQGRQVCAVHFGGRVLILGLGDKQVTLLDTIGDPDEVARLLPPAPPAGQGGAGFGRALAGALARTRRRGGGGDA